MDVSSVSVGAECTSDCCIGVLAWSAGKSRDCQEGLRWSEYSLECVVNTPNSVSRHVLENVGGGKYCTINVMAAFKFFLFQMLLSVYSSLKKTIILCLKVKKKPVWYIVLDFFFCENILFNNSTVFRQIWSSLYDGDAWKYNLSTWPTCKSLYTVVLTSKPWRLYFKQRLWFIFSFLVNCNINHTANCASCMIWNLQM